MVGPQSMGPPLDPSADEARRWAQEELAKAIYNQGPTLLERFVAWLERIWEQLLSIDGAGAVLLPVVVLVLVGLIIAAAMLLGGPVRRRRLQQAPSSMQVLDGDDRGARRLRAAADEAAAAGDYGLAVLERFRALIRGLDERGILADRRGRTAREAAASAGAAFPEHTGDLVRAGELFDAVCYGDAQPGAAEHGWLRALDERIAGSRPTSDGEVRHAEGWSVSQ